MYKVTNVVLEDKFGAAGDQTNAQCHMIDAPVVWA